MEMHSLHLGVETHCCRHASKVPAHVTGAGFDMLQYTLGVSVHAGNAAEVTTADATARSAAILEHQKESNFNLPFG